MKQRIQTAKRGAFIPREIGGSDSSLGFQVVNPGNPDTFQTIQAALTAGALEGLDTIAVWLAQGYDYSADFTVPPGFNVSIVTCAFNYETEISGNITWNGAAGDVLSLTNLFISGTLSGVATGNCYLELMQVGLDSAVAFTGSTVNIEANGQLLSESAYGGYFFSTVSTTGTASLQNVGIYQNFSAGAIQLANVLIQNTPIITSASTSISIRDIDFKVGLPSFVFSGAAGILFVDGYTLAQLGTVVPTNGVVQPRTGFQDATFGAIGFTDETFWARFQIPTTGVNGPADDVALLAANALPFACHVVDCFMKLTNASGGSGDFGQLRDAAAGAGTLFAEFSGDTTGLNRDVTNDEAIMAVSDTLFLRRSDSVIGGALYVLFMRAP